MKLPKILFSRNKSQGQIALTAVLIVLAVSLVVAVSVSLVGIGELDIGLQRSQSQRSFTAAEACLEEAFIRLRDNSAYAGGSLDFDDESCTIGITDLGSNQRQVDITATANDQVRKLRAVVTLGDDFITASGWQEVP